MRNAPVVRRFMPFLLSRRSDAAIYLKQKVDVSRTQAYLKLWNDGTRPKLRLYHVYLAAAVRMFAERPRANRFVAGRRLYQREDVAISMTVLKSRGENGKVSVVKQIYDPGEGLSAVRARTEAIIALGRGDDKTASEKEMALVARLPRWMIPLLLKLQKFGDWFNLVPASMLANDPLYATMMVTFNGTVGLDSVYHHLYEHGTLPIFSVLGPVRDEPVVTRAREVEVRPIMTVRYTIDERIADGHYAGGAMALVKTYIEQPWLLETPEDNGPGEPPL